MLELNDLAKLLAEANKSFQIGIGLKQHGDTANAAFYLGQAAGALYLLETQIQQRRDAITKMAAQLEEKV